MYAFQGGAGHQCVRPGNLEKPCRFGQQKWPEPLATTEARIAHSFHEARGTVQLAGRGGAGKEPIEQGLGLGRDRIEPRKKRAVFAAHFRDCPAQPGYLVPYIRSCI